MTRKTEADPPSRLVGRATIVDVARHAGVSKATVSRFLNHRDSLLAPSMANRVEAAVRELGYIPSPIAQALKQGRSKLVGLVVADITNPFSVSVLRGAEKACQQAGYLIMIFNLGNEWMQEHAAIEALASYQVEGFILNTMGEGSRAAAEIARHGKPTVLVDRRYPGMQADFVSLNNVDAMRLAVAHLVANGYREFLYLTEPTAGVSSRLERASAFRTLMEEGGTRWHGQLMEISASDEESVMAATLSQMCLRRATIPSAVIAGNAVVSLRVAKQFTLLGCHFGVDIGFVGFDETEWAPLIDVGLTTIAQPTDDIGRVAANCLLERLRGAQFPPREVLLQPELIMRASSQKGVHAKLNTAD